MGIESNDRLLTESEVADRLQIKRQTLATWRCQRRGPSYIKIEGAVRYPESRLNAYLGGGVVDHPSIN